MCAAPRLAHVHLRRVPQPAANGCCGPPACKQRRGPAPEGRQAPVHGRGCHAVAPAECTMHGSSRGGVPPPARRTALGPEGCAGRGSRATSQMHQRRVLQSRRGALVRCTVSSSRLFSYALSPAPHASAATPAGSATPACVSAARSAAFSACSAVTRSSSSAVYASLRSRDRAADMRFFTSRAWARVGSSCGPSCAAPGAACRKPRASAGPLPNAPRTGSAGLRPRPRLRGGAVSASAASGSAATPARLACERALQLRRRAGSAAGTKGRAARRCGAARRGAARRHAPAAAPRAVCRLRRQPALKTNVRRTPCRASVCGDAPATARRAPRAACWRLCGRGREAAGWGAVKSCRWAARRHQQLVSPSRTQFVASSAR